MRHRKSGRQLNRNSSHRQAMFRNMMVSLFDHEMITTTVPKAKELRRFAEPMITFAGEDTVSKRRFAFSKLRDKAVTAKLFTVLGPRYKSRPGGYLRLLKCGFRPGDNAPLAIVELVGRDEAQNEAPKAKKAPAKKATAKKAKAKTAAAPKAKKAAK